MLLHHRKRHNIKPTTVMLVGFLGLIIVGALLLMLPVSSRSGRPTDFMTAIFTATSATCVTGLVTVDTAVYWSNFGQIVILLLIQVGGLGFMTLATLASFLLRRTITLRERMVMSTGLNLTDTAGIVRLTRRVLFGTFLFEGIGAFLLAIRFIPQFGLKHGLKLSIFHAVSAFCNAGFDLLGSPGSQFVSAANYVNDPLVNLTLMVLIVLGGLGFFVWNDIFDKRCFKKLRLHTKLVLVTTGVLLFGGFLLTLLFEWRNPVTLGKLPIGGKFFAAAFQSVTLRTAGFCTIDQSALTGASQALGAFLMLIGGSTGSTAGGIKTTTIAVLFLTATTALRGRTNVTSFGRTISPRSIMNAVTMLLVGVSLVLGGSCIISSIEHLPFHMCLFEAVSAFGTVGLSMGITPRIGAASQLLLMILMYLGRVGVLTLGVAVLMRRREPPKMSFPEGRVMVG